MGIETDQMPDRQIKNISKLQHALPVHVKGDVMGHDIVVQLSSGEVFWCPDDRDTKALLVYTKKGFLELTMTEKPSGAKYYEAYPDGHWAQMAAQPDPVEQTEVTVVVDEKEGVRTKWEDDEITYLKRVYPKHGLQHCADKLGRNKHAVKKKVEALKLKRVKDDQV